MKTLTTLPAAHSARRKMKNRRIFTRVKFETDVKLSYNDEVFSLSMADISLAGTSLKLGKQHLDIPRNATGVASFKLPQMNSYAVVELQNMHADQGRGVFGFRFANADDEILQGILAMMRDTMEDQNRLTNEYFWLKLQG